MRRPFFLLLAVAACRPAPAPGIDAGALAADAGSGADAAGGAAPEAEPDDDHPAPMPLRAAVAVVPAGEVPLPEGVEPVVSTEAKVRVEVGVRLTDARLSLLDDDGALVPSTGTTELDGGTKLRLTPSEPLRPGASYLLRLDGVSTRVAHDERGRAYLPIERRFKTSGEKPTPPPKAKKRRRRRRR